MTRERYLRKTAKTPVRATLGDNLNGGLCDSLRQVPGAFEYMLRSYTLTFELCPLSVGLFRQLYSRQVIYATQYVMQQQARDFWSLS